MAVWKLSHKRVQSHQRFGPHLSSSSGLFKRQFILDQCSNVAKVVEDGYEFFAKRQLVTLFSAPNYCGEFDNAGAMMSVDETLLCSFQVRLLIYV